MGRRSSQSARRCDHLPRRWSLESCPQNDREPYKRTASAINQTVSDVRDACPRPAGNESRFEIQSVTVALHARLALRSILKMGRPSTPAPPGASPTAGRPPVPGPSPPCATISTTCSPASATRPLPGEGRSGPPMPSNDGSARSADEHGPREPSGTGHRWTASSTRSSSTKTDLGESVSRSP